MRKLSRIFNSEKGKKEIGNIVVSTSDIQKGDCIAKGGPHGDVYKCLFKKSKTVIKYFNKPDQNQALFKTETETLKKIFHPNVLLIMGIVAEKGTTAVIMETMKCNLFNVLYEPSKCPKALQNLKPLNKFSILRDIAVGLSFIHQLANIPHGDLKLTNILFDETGKVKLGDYFYSRCRTPFKKGNFFVCSPDHNLYQAPEVWVKGVKPEKEADVYSFALIVIEFMSGVADFYPDCNPEDDASIYQAISKKSPVTIPTDFKPSLKDILSRCLSYEPKQRPSMEVVLGTFDSIVVDSTMTSKEASRFWVENYIDGDVPLFEVPYDMFMYVLGGHSLAEYDESELDTVQRELAIYFPESGVVSAVDFDNVVCWFGEFYNNIDIVEEMREISMASFFAGLIDKKTAEGKLSGKTDGTFLVRMSFTDAKKTPFTLTRNFNGAPKHHRIERLSYVIGQPRYSITIEGKKIVSKTIKGIIETLIAKGIICNPDDGEEASNYGEA